MKPVLPAGGYRWSDWPRLLGLALLFAALVKATLHWFPTENDLVSLVWSPSGVALGALLLWGRRYWLGVFLGALLVNLYDGLPVAVGIAFAGVNALEAFAAHWLLAHTPTFDKRLERTTDYLWLLVATAAAAALAAAAGISIMLLGGLVELADAPLKLLHWWQGDALGMALVTPFLLVWSQPSGLGRNPWRRLEAGLALAAVLVAGYFVFMSGARTGLETAPRLYLIFALLPWVAMRFGRHGAMLMVMLVAVLAAIGLLDGSTAFGDPGELVAFYNLWLYLLVLAVVGAMLALTLKQRRLAERQAQQAQADLRMSLDRAELASAELSATVVAQRLAEQALSEQKAFLETMLENEPECVKLVDPRGRLLQMNRAGLAMLEVETLEQAQAIGLSEFVHPEHRKRFIDLHQRVCAGAVERLEFRVIGRRGGQRWLETHAVPFRQDPESPYGLLGVTRDITDRKLAEMREAMHSQAMALIATAEPLAEILDAIVLSVEGLLPGALCSILLLDEDGRRLRVGAAPSLPQAYNAAVDGLVIGPRAGSCGTAAYRGTRVVVGDIANDPLWLEGRAAATAAGLAACWSEPILGHGQRVLGTFAIYYRQPQEPDATDLMIIDGVARLAAIAIERREAEQELRRSEQRYQRVVDNISDALLIDDVEGRVVFANERFLRLFGLNRRQLAKLDFLDHVVPEQRDEIRARHARRISGEEVPEEFEFEGLRSDGERRWLEARVSKVVVDGVITGTQALIRDITERKKSEALIWQQANFDELSGLPNRRMFRDRLAQEVLKCKREGLSLAVLMIDLDHFKEINDTLGHDAGDRLLIEAAHRIRACVRESDTVARLGGDEFVVALSELHGPERVDIIAQGIIDSLAEPFILGNEQGFVSASIGITVYPADAAGIDDLLKHADQAMYVAKDSGRNRFSYFTAALQVAAVARMRLTNDLRQALANGELRAYFQPVLDTASGRVVKAEALIRWMHPQRGMVSPADFIPLAETSGLIYGIGEWMFQQALFWGKRWRERFDPDFQISVNQSPLEFQREGRRHVDWVAALQAQGLPGSALIVEITEGLLLDASASVSEKLLGLRDAGIQVALDDFGTGYSSLAYLKQFDIDYLKIDQSFTRALAPGSSSLAMSEAIIVMAHKLGLKVIAEGVETAEQRALLEAAGCDALQGYLLGRPMPAMEFEALMQSQAALPGVVPAG